MNRPSRPWSRLARPLPLAIALLAAAAPAPGRADKPSAAPGTPLAQIKATNDRIDKVLKSKKSADDPAARAEMRAIVNGFLDYDELARRSLGIHWEKLQKPQREEFTRTLRELIEKSYEKRLRTDLDYSISYGAETMKGEDATVATTVKVKTKGKSTDASIDYKLRKVGDKWLVFDVITDEVSMVRSYREQFNKIISTEGFDELLKKMRKKIAETDSGTSADKTSAKASDKKAAAK